MDFDDLDEARTYSIIIYGATGAVGNAMAEHLYALCQAEDCVFNGTWAVAGRSADKLRAVAAKFESPPGVYIASTPEEICEMAGDCKVLVNAVGPYLPHGEAVVKACIDSGTHYVDITGEVVWIARMVNKYHEAAKEKGVMIVHCAGVMCAPDDIMLYMLAEKLGPLASFKELIFQCGSMQYGTWESARIELASMDADDLKSYQDPYCISAVPKGGRRKEDEDMQETEQDADFESFWLTPQHGSHCAHRILRRTCTLFEQRPSDEEVAAALAKSEDVKILVADVHLDKSGATAATASARRIADMRECSKRLITMEDAVKRNAAFKPGDVPSKECRAMSGAEQIGIAQGKNGEWAHVHMTGPDPGVDFTSICAVTCAIVLVEETASVNPEERGGVLTPAYALHGSTWIQQLQAYSFAGGENSRKPVFELKEGKPSEDYVKQAHQRIGESVGTMWAKINSDEIPKLAPS